MWPFDSGDKDASELTKLLPESLQGFFRAEEASKSTLHDDQIKSEKVQSVLAKHHRDDSGAFKLYKDREPPKAAAKINCADLQLAAIECYRSMGFTGGTDCRPIVQRALKCAEIQQRGLNRLRYQECYDKRQCTLIRGIVDHAFIHNFGLMGEKINEETERDFERSIDSAFDLAWK